MNDIKTTCASCGGNIETHKIKPEVYYNRFGNYCLKCNSRISANAQKHYRENVETLMKYNYEYIKKKKHIDNF